MWAQPKGKIFLSGFSQVLPAMLGSSFYTLPLFFFSSLFRASRVLIVLCKQVSLRVLSFGFVLEWVLYPLWGAYSFIQQEFIGC